MKGKQMLLGNDKRSNGCNKTLKDYARNKGVAQWEIAEKLGMHEVTLCRKLRVELTEDEALDVKHIIDAIAKEKTNEI